MRGEYRDRRHAIEDIAELPPRARRIPDQVAYENTARGTTSACAENTCSPGVFPAWYRNYLRVRGEYSWVLSMMMGCTGTTSACAENTVLRINRSMSYRNYLRVRGEYMQTYTPRCLITELPPRARRIRGFVVLAFVLNGTTSACAENTENTG